MHDMPNLAAWLRARRAVLRSTQEEVATALGVSVVLLSQWENGHTLPNKVEQVIKLAAWGEVDAVDVFTLCARDAERMSGAA